MHVSKSPRWENNMSSFAAFSAGTVIALMDRECRVIEEE